MQHNYTTASIKFYYIPFQVSVLHFPLAVVTAQVLSKTPILVHIDNLIIGRLGSNNDHISKHKQTIIENYCINFTIKTIASEDFQLTCTSTSTSRLMTASLKTPSWHRRKTQLIDHLLPGQLLGTSKHVRLRTTKFRKP